MTDPTDAPEDYTSSVIPTWTNLAGDGGFWVHARTVEDFMTYAVEPTFSAIEVRIAHLLETQEGAWQFEESDLEELRVETARAFALSLQSFWERQFRGWVGSANDQLKRYSPDSIRRADWSELRQMFFKLKGIDVARIGRWRELEKLNLIGNTCRHGEGKSADDLRARHPELWPSPHDGVVISLAGLRELAAAIVDFWAAAEDVYDNSIRRKHPSTVKKVKLAEARWRRAEESGHR